ncbi:uncharacterized protein (TIGR02231 family) [Litoreibacter ponti]|uniref:Uncharacterized protein (TIGR02231 family) n=1 Tax=Litoreibacter ponti TaxID=1510457 RepID=A0A2T6BPN2_9RHOB|nr:DUF4139 domain-containing protein [Litoreibacter ponti]PTX58012.1 uncharacterized protein (TIGR02231 family) [Litoreibacter ponti]
MLRSLSLAALLVTSTAYAEEVFIVPNISQVTVYPQGASVTRVVAAELPAGEHIIRIPYLRQGFSVGPPRVSTADNVAVGAIRLLPNHFTDPKDARTPEQIAAADRVEAARDAVQALEDRVILGQAQVEAQKARNAYLRTLTGAAQTSTDPDALKAAADMVAAELSSAWTAQYQASIALRADEKARDEARVALGLAEAEFQALNPPTGPLTLLEMAVETGAAGPVELTIDTLVYNAGWRADYDLDLTRGDDASIAMERKVVLQQSTGERWSEADLILSTANPFAQVDPTEPFPNQASIFAKGKAGYGVSVRSQAEDVSSFARAGSAADLEVEAVAAPTAQAVIDGLSVTYDYPTPVSLASGGSELILALDDFTFDAREFNRAAPRFDETAFLMAEFTNSTPEPFLPGQVSVSRDGVFVGRSDLDLVPAGAKAEVSFGSLEGLRLDYKLLDNDTGDRGFLTSSSTRVQQMEFSVENLLDTTEQVQTIFALPYSEQENLEVSVSTRPNPADADFEQKRGVSVWDLELGPGEKRTVRVNVQMDWPDGQQLQWRP